MHNVPSTVVEMDKDTEDELNSKQVEEAVG